MQIAHQWRQYFIGPEVLLFSVSKQNLQEDSELLQDVGVLEQLEQWSNVLWFLSKSSGLVFSICFHSGQVHMLLIYYCLSSAWQEHLEAPPEISSCQS